MTVGFDNPPAAGLLCMENRMLAADATGVATYARALRAAQQMLSPGALLLGGGRASAPGSPSTRAERWLRSVRALGALPAGIRAHAAPEGFVRHDLFRLGQAFFTLSGRLMPVHVPGARSSRVEGIMHWSYPVPLRVVGWRNVYTVHDVIPLTHPDLSPIEPVRHRRLLGRIAASADAIVTVSQAAAGDIIAALDLPPGRVVDCSQPVAVADPGNAPLPAGLTAGRYLLVCGTVEPRKNIARIVAAYGASGTALPLVIAGPDGWQSEAVSKVLAETPGIVRLPYQSRAAMVALLAQARALIMPSLAEGFGLPVAEAMALGTPVVTSATGALAETAGGATLLVNPLDTRAIAVAIAKVAQDGELCHRLVHAGRVRAARFDAGAFADRLRMLYDRLEEPMGSMRWSA
jgi:glycosyltransferase involved in cell wall biosynthesis